MASTMDSNVAAVVGGLQRVASVVDAQVTAGIPRDQAIDNLFVSFRAQVSSLNVRHASDDLHTVISAANAGPWTADQKRELAQLVVSASTAEANNRIQKRRKNQKCLHWENYFTDAEWVLARAKQVDNSLAVLFAHKAQELGLFNPCEVTLFNMVKLIAFLQCWNTESIDQDKVKSMKLTIQTMIKQKTPDPALPYIEVYPFSADGLPELVKRAAFRDGSLPTVVNIPELHTVLDGTSPRG